MDGIIPRCILQIVLIALNAVFAASEIAIISVNDAKLDEMARKGNKKAKKLVRLTSVPSKFLATIQISITLSGFLGSAFAADGFAGPLAELIMKTGVGIPENTLREICVVCVTLLLSFLTLVFGELVPKRIAMKKAEKLALGIAGLIYGISKIFTPFVWFLSVCTNGVLRLCGINPNEQDEVVTEEEIRMMIDQGSEKGTIDAAEREMLTNIFEFDDLTAGEICTHRTDVDILWAEEDIAEWRQKIVDTRHKCYVVCNESADDIIGVLNAKDFFASEPETIREAFRDVDKRPYLVPESIKIDVLFKNMKSKHKSFAIVLDEYGGMEGVVTFTDILECIVGDFDEEPGTDDTNAPEIEKTGENTWIIRGETLISDVCDELDTDIPDEDFDTFSGYVVSLLARIPHDGEMPVIETDSLTVRVLLVKNHIVDTSEVTKKEKKTEDD